MALKIERKIWQPAFPNEIWITDERGNEEFEIMLKQGSENIQIEFTYNYGTERTEIPIKLLKELLEELNNKTVEHG